MEKTSLLSKGSRVTKAFRSKKENNAYWFFLTFLFFLSLLAIYGLLVYDNPVPITSSSFLPVVRRRIYSVIAMLIAASCQSLATITFQTVTNNRIITPSLLGFESVYTLIQTSIIFFFGANALVQFTGLQAFLLQVSLMILVCILLYSWLLNGQRGNLQLMLLVGVILGQGLHSISNFMKRVLSPSEYDILQARMFASVNNADADYFPIAIILVVICLIFLFFYTNTLNILALGKDVCKSLGLNYQKHLIITLIIVSVLMAVSTALVGPMTFLGFLVATFTYQLAPTYNHRYLFPMGLVLSFLILCGAYFIMNHVFYAQGVVGIIIELFGGIVFLLLIFKKGNL